MVFYFLISGDTKWKSFLIILINGKKVERDPEEKKKRMGEFFAWVDKYSKTGNLKDGVPLSVEGKLFSYIDGETVVMDTTEDDTDSIAGSFVLEAENWEAASEIIMDCPQMVHGGKISLRKMVDIPKPG